MRVRQVVEVEVPGLHDRIRAAREAKKMSLQALCKNIGVSRSYWGRVELGQEKSVPLDRIKLVERALDINLGIPIKIEPGKNG